MAKSGRHLRKSLKITLIIIFILAIGVFALSKTSLFKDNDVVKKIEKKIEEKENPIKTYKANLIATGDALAHSVVYKAAYNSASNDYDFSGMLSYTSEKLKNYDIKYYNQETVFDDSRSYSGYPMFNTPSALGRDMIKAGFNVVSLATNHSMDMGATSAKKSASWWESQENVLSAGMASSEEARTNYKIMEANGITYTLLSYTYGTNGLGGSAISQEPYIVNLFDEEKVKADIAAVRDKVDVLMVAMHWGVEYNLETTQTQKDQARFLANNGVDIVLGTHSHCLEPWEKIGDTVVFYSFGNFVSNQMGAEQAVVRKVGTIGVFATLDITKVVDTENNTTTITIDNIGADLNYSYRYYNSSKGVNDYLVIPFSSPDIKKYLANYDSLYNEFSAVLKKYDDSITIEPLAGEKINTETSEDTN